MSGGEEGLLKVHAVQTGVDHSGGTADSLAELVLPKASCRPVTGPLPRPIERQQIERAAGPKNLFAMLRAQDAMTPSEKLEELVRANLAAHAVETARTRA